MSHPKLANELARYAFSKDETKRAICPCCGTRAPHPDDMHPDVATREWYHSFGHRCPHGVPCPSFGRKFGARCGQCHSGPDPVEVHA